MTDAPRNLALERERTDEPARELFGIESSVTLSRFAEERAGDGPVVNVERRDFGREVREELADARNYLVWWLQLLDIVASQINGNGAMRSALNELRAAVAQALAGVAFAYCHAERACALEPEVRP